MTSTPPASKSPKLFICTYACAAAAFFLLLLSSVQTANAQLECFHFCFPDEPVPEIRPAGEPEPGAGCCVPLPPSEPEPLPMPLPLPVEPPRPIASGPILNPSSTSVGEGISSSSSIATPAPIPPVESLVPGVTIPGGAVHDGANGGQKLGNSNAETMPGVSVPGGTVHDGANGGQKIGDKVLPRGYNRRRES